MDDFLRWHPAGDEFIARALGKHDDAARLGVQVLLEFRESDMQPRSLPKSSHFNQDARPEVADFEDEGDIFAAGEDACPAAEELGGCGDDEIDV